MENPRKIVENRNIFLDFSQIIAHRNPHTVKMDLGNFRLNGELWARIRTCTSGVLVNSWAGYCVTLWWCPWPRSSAVYHKNMATKVPSLFTISFNSLLIVRKNSQNMLEQTRTVLFYQMEMYKEHECMYLPCWRWSNVYYLWSETLKCTTCLNDKYPSLMNICHRWIFRFCLIATPLSL